MSEHAWAKYGAAIVRRARSGLPLWPWVGVLSWPLAPCRCVGTPKASGPQYYSVSQESTARKSVGPPWEDAEQPGAASSEYASDAPWVEQ